MWEEVKRTFKIYKPEVEADICYDDDEDAKSDEERKREQDAIAAKKRHFRDIAQKKAEHERQQEVKKERSEVLQEEARIRKLAGIDTKMKEMGIEEYKVRETKSEPYYHVIVFSEENYNLLKLSGKFEGKGVMVHCIDEDGNITS